MNTIGLDIKIPMRVVANTSHQRPKNDDQIGQAGEGEKSAVAGDVADFDLTAAQLIEEFSSGQLDGGDVVEPSIPDAAQMDEVAVPSDPVLRENDQKSGSVPLVTEGHVTRLPDDVLRLVELADRGSRAHIQTGDRGADERLSLRQDGIANALVKDTDKQPTTKSALTQVARPDHQKPTGIEVAVAESGKSRTASETAVGRGQQLHSPQGAEVVSKGVQVAAVVVQSAAGHGLGHSHIKSGVSSRQEGSDATLRSRLSEAVLQSDNTASKVAVSTDRNGTQAQHRSDPQSFESEIDTSILVENNNRDPLPNNARANVVNVVANALLKELEGQAGFRPASFGHAGAVASPQSLEGMTTKPLKSLTIQLTPQHLGQVVAKIAYSGDELKIDLAPEGTDAVRLLRQDREVLIEMLRATGLTVPDEAVRVVEATRNDQQFSTSLAGKEDVAGGPRQETMESSDRRQRDGEQRAASSSDEQEQYSRSERDGPSLDQESRRGIYF